MKNLKASVFFIFATIVLDMIGIGLIIPVLPDVMKRFVSSETELASYFGYFISVYALMQFLAAPFLGALSDRFGRRPVLFVSLVMAAFDYLLMAYAPNLSILFLGRVLSGLSGANITVAMAYIADVSDDKNRSANFGMVGAAFGLGFIVGPALGGLLGHWSPHFPFLAAAALNVINLIYGIAVLPESLPVESRRNIHWHSLNPVKGLVRVVTSRFLLPLMIVHFCFQLAGQTHPSIWTLYTRHKFDWTMAQIGFSLAAVGVLSAISQGFLTRIVIPKLGEQRTVLIGCLGQVFAFAMFGVITQGWMVYAVLIFSSVFWVAGPALQSLITQSTPGDRQGELQGQLVSLTSLAAILNPMMVTQLFSHFSNREQGVYLPGAPYFFAAFVMLLACLALNLRSQNAHH